MAAAQYAARGSHPSSSTRVRAAPVTASPNGWRSVRCRAAAAAAAGADAAASLLAQPVRLQPGTAYLVSTGPGSIDLLTLKAARVIASATCVVTDELGTQEVLDLLPPSCERHFVGKRGGQASIKQPAINELLVGLCRQGKAVVRLKGGCCSTFSRVSSEIAALAAAGCPWEVLPGVSSATSAPVLAGFPLTDTQLAGSFAVVSGHDAAAVQWAAFSRVPTLVVLMAGRQLSYIAQQLIATGWPPNTPVAVIKEAGLPSQASWFSTLHTLDADMSTVSVPLSPCVVVVGEVAGLPAAWQAVREQQQQPPPQQADGKGGG